MRILEDNETDTELHEIQILVDATQRFAEMVEVYRESSDGPGFIQVTSVKLIGQNADFDEDNNASMRRFIR